MIYNLLHHNARQVLWFVELVLFLWLGWSWPEERPWYGGLRYRRNVADWEADVNQECIKNESKAFLQM